MNELLAPLQHPFLQRALWTALVVGFANGFLSGYIVIRRSALVVGSMSHALLPGIALAVLIGGLSAATAFLGGLFSALLVGIGAFFLSRTSRLDDGTALAVLYTGAFAVGLLLIEVMPIKVQLEDWLFGNILAQSNADLITSYAASVLILVGLTIFHRPIIITLFEPNIAASQGIQVRRLGYLLTGLIILGLVTSIQAVGCILSVAMLVAPAAIIRQFANSPASLIWGGGVVGAIIAASGVILAYLLNLRIGATIAILLSAGVILAYLFSPRYGAFWAMLQRPPRPH
ncbi:MAG: metal ABC transporter permease [Puniceicoccaceae bacterium]